MRSFPALLLLATSGLAASGPAAAEAAPIDAQRYSHLARGVNLTRWFQYGSYIPIDESARDMLRSAGFNAVRIAVAPQYLLGKWAKPEEIERNLSRLDRGIDLFLRVGMSVTLDFQADVDYLDYYFATSGTDAELIDTWRMLATRYADRDPELLFFEIMNEPDTRFTQAAWDRVQRRALAEIRRAAPRHTVLLAPTDWSGLEGLLRMTPYEDPNVVYVLHYYSPSTFTHQGADWTDQPGIAALRDVPWPAWLPTPEQADPRAAERVAAYQAEDWDREHIEWDMRLAAQWARQWNVSIIINEFGAYKRFARPDSRNRWLRDVRVALESQHLAWAVWDYAAGFDVTERAGAGRRIDPAVAAALGLSPPASGKTEPTRTPPSYTGPLMVEIGALSETLSEAVATPFDMNGAGYPLLVATSANETPVKLFQAGPDGIVHPAQFEGSPPVAAKSLIVAGHFDRSGRFGYFFPGQTSKLALPGTSTLEQAPLPQIAATSAAAGDVNRDGIDDLVIFGSELQLLRNGGNGKFEAVPHAFPPLKTHFDCGVLVDGQLTAFGEGGGATFFSKGDGHFRAGKRLPPTGGLGACTAVAGPAEILVAWANDTLLVYPRGKSIQPRAVASIPIPSSKHGVRRIALAGSLLVVTRPGEAPLIFNRQSDGKYAPSYVNPANNLSVCIPIDLDRDGLTDLLYAQGGNAPLIGRFRRR